MTGCPDGDDEPEDAGVVVVSVGQGVGRVGPDGTGLSCCSSCSYSGVSVSGGPSSTRNHYYLHSPTPVPAHAGSRTPRASSETAPPPDESGLMKMSSRQSPGVSVCPNGPRTTH